MSNITDADKALYRAVAEALAARGHTGLLDTRCSCEVLVSDNSILGYHHEYDAACPNCSGTGSVVPSEAECGWRLMLAVKNKRVSIGNSTWPFGLQIYCVWQNMPDSAPLLPTLLRAVAASVGAATEA